MDEVVGEAARNGKYVNLLARDKPAFGVHPQSCEDLRCSPRQDIFLYPCILTIKVKANA